MPAITSAQVSSFQSPTIIYANLVDTKDAVMDGVASAFGKQYSAAVDSVDVPKKWNEEIENMAIIRHDTALAIEFRSIPTTPDTLFYRLYLRQHPYKLEVFSQNLAPDFPGRAWLVDNYLHKKTEINLKDTSLYNFTPNIDTNSYRNRFMLVLSPVNNSGKIRIDSLIRRIKSHIYPNPVSSGEFQLVLENAKEDNYIINVYTMMGTLAATKSIIYRKEISTYKITIADNLPNGNYKIQMLNSSGVIVSVLSLMINRR